MSDQKPGCIHPRDPEGCLGTFATIVVTVIFCIAHLADVIKGSRDR